MPNPTQITLRHPIGISAVFSSFGARLLQLNVPDKHGRLTNVVLGYSEPEKYEEFQDDLTGATVGRLAGRVPDSIFIRDDVSIPLASNSHPHHLHGGGVEALDRVLWEISDLSESEVTFTHVSSHGSHGYPGNLNVQARFSLTEDCGLLIEYSATTDSTTPVNLTHHSYWNLSGTDDEDLEQHYLRIKSIEALRTIDMIPSGDIDVVVGSENDYSKLTPFSLRPWKELDHSFILSAPGVAAELWHPATGICLTLTTDQPILQVYSGKFLSTYRNVGGSSVRPGRGIALEPQYTNSSIDNRPALQSQLLAPGERYTNTMKFRFSSLSEFPSISTLHGAN